MLDVDLTIPIAILTVAVILVLVIRAWAGWKERRTDERTEALVRELEASDETRSEDAPRAHEAPTSEDGQGRAPAVRGSDEP